MAAAAGKTGTVDGSGSDVVSWTVNLETDLVDVSHMGGNGYKEYLECLEGGTGTVTMLARKTGGSTVALINASNTYSGSVKWDSEAVETPVDGRLQYTHNFNFHGTITVS